MSAKTFMTDEVSDYPKSKLIVEVIEIAKPEASAATMCDVPGLMTLSATVRFWQLRTSRHTLVETLALEDYRPRR